MSLSKSAELQRKLGLRTQVVRLPSAWMVNGKADWDGAAALLRDRLAMAGSTTESAHGSKGASACPSNNDHVTGETTGR